MACWTTPSKAGTSLREIMATEEREKGDEDLARALAASLGAADVQQTPDDDLARALAASMEENTSDEALQQTPANDDEALARAVAMEEDTSDEALARALLESESKDLALALSMEEEDRSREREKHRLAAVRAAAARHERVRVVAHVGEGDEVSCPSDETEGVTMDEMLAAEGIVVDGKLQRKGLIGRRTDGSLVSKHDPSLDARLKAQCLLQDSVNLDAGDVSDARVPARVYNHLLRKTE